jgi:hypothetical protein
VHRAGDGSSGRAGRDLQRLAWQWALATELTMAHCRAGGRLPATTTVMSGGVDSSRGQVARASSASGAKPACVWSSPPRSACRVISRPASAGTVISTPVPRLGRAGGSCPPARTGSSAAAAWESPGRPVAQRKMFPAPSVTAGRKATSADQRERSLPAPAASAARARLTHGQAAATLTRKRRAGTARPERTRPVCNTSCGDSQSLDHGSTRTILEDARFAPVLTLRELVSSVLNTRRHPS